MNYTLGVDILGVANSPRGTEGAYPPVHASCTMRNVTKLLRNVTEALRKRYTRNGVLRSRYGTLRKVTERYRALRTLRDISERYESFGFGLQLVFANYKQDGIKVLIARKTHSS